MHTNEQTEQALFCIRPQYFNKRNEIEELLKRNNLVITHSIPIWLTVQDINVLYQNESAIHYLEATRHFMTRGFSQVGIITGKNVIQSLITITGTSHIPMDNPVGTVRRDFGIPTPFSLNNCEYYLNPIHRTSDYDESQTSCRYFFEILSQRSPSQIIHDMMKQLYLDKNLECVFQQHVLIVQKFCEELCRTQGGNSKMLQIAALLHDIGSIKNGSKLQHHALGVEYAKEILAILNFNAVDTELICECILSHSKSGGKTSYLLEAEILRSADGIANITETSLLYFYNFNVKKLSYSEGIEAIRKKVESSYSKIAP